MAGIEYFLAIVCREPHWAFSQVKADNMKNHTESQNTTFQNIIRER
jgi:hypothetical protein